MKDELEGLRPLRLAFVAFLVLTIASAGASCKRTRVEPAANANTASEADYSATTPPFSTKEPERYQWTRVITSVTAGDANSAGQPAFSQTAFIARDADKRRE